MLRDLFTCVCLHTRLVHRCGKITDGLFKLCSAAVFAAIQEGFTKELEFNNNNNTKNVKQEVLIVLINYFTFYFQNYNHLLCSFNKTMFSLGTNTLIPWLRFKTMILQMCDSCMVTPAKTQTAIIQTLLIFPLLFKEHIASNNQ